ncbi:MAG: hydroxymyristoyl-ACP dehydratase [Clostridiales bacterium]|jgi:hypothetical protein|nr:hydroxymyristoyl-ACP dehydratase [Eubacteriales bacterium]MDH7566081.1 hydroxymyristoyl-ACP dehydratase [Clostridiales bacterium]
MTTINCSSNCIHQHDGKCTLDNTEANSVSTVSDCIYYQERPPKQSLEQK